MVDPNRLWRGALNEIAEGVWYLPIMMANVYFLGKRGGPWVLVDAGVRGGAWRIRQTAMETFGQAPECIVLTHGHFDHVGALPQLAQEWNAPVYAHALETPFLNGSSDYPPPDPTVGGFMAQMSRLFPHSGIDLGIHLRTLPEDGSIPGLPEWTWIHTPGHTSGHVSLFRDRDRTVIAGDAVITINQENAAKLMSQYREFRNPPRYLTQDWGAAERSVQRLAGLRPNTVATGHGLPMCGDWVADELARFAANFTPPDHGRYVNTPVRSDEYGILYVPPAPPDPLPMYAAGAGLAAAAGLLLYAASRRKGRGSSQDLATTGEATYEKYRKDGYRG
jgi:glyoxylase-like metal-dependent hydrolase (beta-lactamase superfamily II)